MQNPNLTGLLKKLHQAAAAPASDADMSSPSTSTQPQPAYPDGEPQ